ncbi:acetyl-CoA carboxylase biotin carboxylase subunit [Rhodospirillum rubrum]|uniref:propionyl-CoA carboxylase n=1 Tax=Rhodospirillum rubrum (strain ATCC 11170 / ATH 1.1.1 / DSM 467 / LMG 4362 / NCIMB 8255 / S1) TaxID=269796 RepID=Q2RYD8_RHORT|nr:acetyl/propionyl/methylcrotonyl-CoA carboxylase subunit alpha [Rhodospirillum rubrum]ABC20857.1 Biotin carboxylase [Rhodospirillum rubrum ATCC 11170]AEO46524.1 biotin carboxylase [Rhodospirillum rubrum F11]MBK5952414.1 acetyl/propionyl-CoA carboxylase subunit alpha [Rhodospirillum rubrum]QXG80559.1 acetyl/propionyl/methylcrotonyl-CoA carboxylase subunit alpha [Rhodospirillum rubrum]HAQ00663.1 acetyl/propionyl/methylcrotonyl-CoA carboxylase subunit alpha [Rhodospirillum rubrum]
MFDKILIANRGEIACRVIKTARKMGIKTVSVYSDADRNAVHTDMADEKVHIGGSASAQSYLVIERIVEACKRTGAQAVHPGYGFLSENKAFQIALAKEGIAFIGPDALAIQAMGDKIESKKLAAKAGVSTVPGYMGVIKDAEEAARIASEIGFPVMIKASAGGGGKGMRVAWSVEEAREGFVSATNEAKSSFGDDRVFIEKFIEQPRHIEIQILADGETYLYVNERECSIQRRNQKVVEEAPSPFLTPEVRKAMGEQAVALAKVVDYKSAGTIEFIVDAARNFYFLEMNTRLQVEHPVTEMITGLDLVEWMIRIAAGEKLTLRQEDIGIDGWAMECRIYAEDPYRNFLPSIGRLVQYAPPEEIEGQVRVDTGVENGGEISMYYDPMIAKLVTHGADRAEAIHRMRNALDAFLIRGVAHNIPFLASLLSRERFVEGRLTTNFIAEEYANGFNASDLPPEDPSILIAVAATVHQKGSDRNANITGQIRGHEKKLKHDWVVRLNGTNHLVNVRSIDGGHEVVLEHGPVNVYHDWKFGHSLFRCAIDGREVCVQIEREGVGYRLHHAGTQASALVLTPETAHYASLMLKKEPPDMSLYLLSPMPGLLVSLAVEEGHEVKAGETLAVIEAMKMENILKAQHDGVIAKVHSKPGDSLSVDQKILEFAP